MLLHLLGHPSKSGNIAHVGLVKKHRPTLAAHNFSKFPIHKSRDWGRLIPVFRVLYKRLNFVADEYKSHTVKQ